MSLQTMIDAFLTEMEEMSRTPTFKGNKTLKQHYEELQDIANHIAIDPDYLEENGTPEYLNYESYKVYLQEKKSKARRQRTVNSECTKCGSKDIEYKETYMECKDCGNVIQLISGSKVSKNAIAYKKGKLDVYTGEATIKKSIEPWLNSIYEWLTNLKYFNEILPMFPNEIKNKAWETKDAEMSNIRSDIPFSKSNIPSRECFNYVIEVWYIYVQAYKEYQLSVTAGNAFGNPLFRPVFTVGIDVSKPLPPKYTLTAQYYLLMIHLFNARKLALAPEDKNKILDIMTEYNNYRSDLASGHKHNSSLFGVVLELILKLPMFGGKYNYILPYLTECKHTTQNSIETFWTMFCKARGYM